MLKEKIISGLQNGNSANGPPRVSDSRWEMLRRLAKHPTPFAAANPSLVEKGPSARRDTALFAYF